ncbi:acyl carrier protein [Sneathiella sp.]|uniref:acyl carrier protein n=1 Tax=Sneathiella sp. TaxID=1964365 RepID=UPI00356692E4
MTREQVYERLKIYLTDLFEVPPEDIMPEARLYEDLDLDSIDAVDLVVKLQDLTSKKIPPEEFKTVRTVDDVVDRVYALLEE